MTQYESQYERMIKQPIPSLILTLALPTTISMLVTNIYNMADTYFVSTVGTSATGAVGIVFGLMAILQAFGFMFGHGAGANISRRLGAKRVEEARIFASTSFFWLTLFWRFNCGTGSYIPKPAYVFNGINFYNITLYKSLCLLYFDCRTCHDFIMCDE